jgi:predicted nucleic acid-binding protein
MTAVLVDTNVLVYAYDRSESEKQLRALAVLDRLVEADAGVLSTQILAEFYNTVTYKLASPLTPAQAHRRLEQYVQVWKVLDVTPQVVLEAVRGTREYGFHFWDAQIWAAARLNGIATILSEDFSAGAEIEGVRFANPFAVEFSPEDWGL